MESESKDAKIQELNDKLGVISENKGTELLQALSSVNEEGDKKSKAALIQEISQKSNEILELKEKLAQAMHNLRNSKSNPFEKAGGSDDEDNKERVQQRTSIEGMVSILYCHMSNSYFWLFSYNRQSKAELHTTVLLRVSLAKELAKLKKMKSLKNSRKRIKSSLIRIRN